MSGRLSCVSMQAYFEGQEASLGFGGTCVRNVGTFVYLLEGLSVL